VESAFFLYVVVREGSTVLQLLASEDEPLLVRGNPFLVLDLGLNVLNRVRGLHLEGDGLPSQGLDEDLHPATEPEHKVEGALLLDVIVGEGPAVLQLLASKDEPLLVRGNALLVLDFSLDILDRVRRLHLQSNGFASQGLDKDLHSATEPQNQVKSALLLDVVVGEGPTVLQLLASEDEPLLIWGNALLVLNKRLSQYPRIMQHFS